MHLGSYKKLDVGMFEGVLKDEAGAGQAEGPGSVKVIIFKAYLFVLIIKAASVEPCKSV